MLYEMTDILEQHLLFSLRSYGLVRQDYSGILFVLLHFFSLRFFLVSVLRSQEDKQHFYRH